MLAQARFHAPHGAVCAALLAPVYAVFMGLPTPVIVPITLMASILLIKHAGKVVTHRQLLKEVWGPDSVFETHYLRVYMAHLRRKIETDPAQPHYLLTEAGIGYRLSTE